MWDVISARHQLLSKISIDNVSTGNSVLVQLLC